MVKRLRLATRAFGAEPGQPEAGELAEWVAVHRGRIADIITFQLDRSLAPQLDAGIMTTCAGGKFYADRVLSAIAGIVGRKATGELHVETRDINEDAAGIVVQKKGAWVAIPAPHMLGITDRYYHDDEEWSDALCGAYRSLMRAMRDIGVPGHILLCDTMVEAELVALAEQRVFFLQPAPDKDGLARLMEHQRQVAVNSDQIRRVFDLTGEYSLQKLFVIDPDPASVSLALSHLDPDQVAAGGYCTEGCGEYWKTVVKTSVYEK